MHMQMRTSFDQQSQKSTWVKWTLIILLLIIIASTAYMIVIYNQIQQDKKTGFTETEEIVLQETDLVEISDIERYHGEAAYHIVFGKTENDEHKIVYVPLTNDEQDLITIDQSEMISKETLENQLQNECNTCKIISIIPGIENSELLWELTYVDDSGRYVLEYVSIHDGTQYEQFRFTQTYK